MQSNIVLIGMPGSGKSTVGVLLAKRTMKDFVDTDLLIQSAEKRALQDILDNEGYLALRAVEERVILSMNVQNHVVATGGSAAYSNQAMQHLRSDGTVVFLDVDADTLRRRITDYETRGIAKRPDQTFADLFEERMQLYRKYADITIRSATLNPEQTADRVVEEIMQRMRC